ncbi:MAG: glycosyltransferase [Kiritimatiellae bacterium]|nr:glycosyltransferase [Kiritimatiellia bacterium]MBQ8126754.1 glycosyltransferase [Kiritimatiellia bacterium]
MKKAVPEDMKDAHGLSIDVSVVVPTHRRHQFLKDALQSVFKQKGVGFEVIVVNGVEDDTDTDAVVSEFDVVKYIRSKEYLSCSSKRALGLSLAKGRYIHFIDDDDYMIDDDFYRKAVALLDSNGEISSFSGNSRFRFESTEGGEPKYSDAAPLPSGRINGLEYFKVPAGMGQARLDGDGIPQSGSCRRRYPAGSQRFFDLSSIPAARRRIHNRRSRLRLPQVGRLHQPWWRRERLAAEDGYGHSERALLPYRRRQNRRCRQVVARNVRHEPQLFQAFDARCAGNGAVRGVGRAPFPWRWRARDRVRCGTCRDAARSIRGPAQHVKSPQDVAASQSGASQNIPRRRWKL